MLKICRCRARLSRIHCTAGPWIEAEAIHDGAGMGRGRKDQEDELQRGQEVGKCEENWATLAKSLQVCWYTTWFSRIRKVKNETGRALEAFPWKAYIHQHLRVAQTWWGFTQIGALLPQICYPYVEWWTLKQDGAQLLWRAWLEWDKIQSCEETTVGCHWLASHGKW